ncbi:MAG TPA: Fe(2+)-trafficking protein [Phycisphaerae bacterium]|nr:Fe(2+)-trafficking protein [Phycisphaerae bacterium]
MAANTVKCAKLGRELPGLDPNTPKGDQALKMVLLIAGPETQKRVRENISAQAWQQWTDHMRMVINEFRLDPTSDEANKVLAEHMEAFFFGAGTQLPGYVPPGRSADQNRDG